MRRSQRQLLLEIIKQNKEVIPAKLCGNFYLGQIFGSDITRRARELREKGILDSREEGQFTVFFIKEKQPTLF